MKEPKLVIIGIAILCIYFGSYALMYYRKSPAGNLAYFQYLSDGTDRQEWAVYYFYYPVYRVHTWIGCVHHVWDRERFPHDAAN
jgi:hypothetical protein